MKPIYDARLERRMKLEARQRRRDALQRALTVTQSNILAWVFLALVGGLLAGLGLNIAVSSGTVPMLLVLLGLIVCGCAFVVGTWWGELK